MRLSVKVNLDNDAWYERPEWLDEWEVRDRVSVAVARACRRVNLGKYNGPVSVLDFNGNKCGEVELGDE